MAALLFHILGGNFTDQAEIRDSYTVKSRKQAAACTNFFFKKFCDLQKEIYLYFHKIWHQFNLDFIKS